MTMAGRHIPAWPRQVGGRVQMGVEADQPAVQGAGPGLGGRRGKDSRAINHNRPA